METLDYFRAVVLLQIVIVMCLFAQGGLGDMLHYGKIQTETARTLFKGRILLAFAVVLMGASMALSIISRFGQDDLNPYSVLAQVAMPLLVLAWGFIYRNRYTSVGR